MVAIGEVVAWRRGVVGEFVGGDAGLGADDEANRPLQSHQVPADASGISDQEPRLAVTLAKPVNTGQVWSRPCPLEKVHLKGNRYRVAARRCLGVDAAFLLHTLRSRPRIG